MMDYQTTAIIKKFVVNFLVHNKKYDNKSANILFDKNVRHFKAVFEILGDELLNKIGENIDEK